jgi:RimJ/RimL family protein N-acetyltransferase
MAERLNWGANFCFGVYAAGRLVSYAWFAERAIEAEHSFFFPLRLPPNTVYEYKAYTVSEFRGQGIHGAALLRAAKHFRRRGFAQILGIVEARNEASLRSHEKLGFRRAGRLVTFKQRPLACTCNASVCMRERLPLGAT